MIFVLYNGKYFSIILFYFIQARLYGSFVCFRSFPREAIAIQTTQRGKADREATDLIELLKKLELGVNDGSLGNSKAASPPVSLNPACIVEAQGSFITGLHTSCSRFLNDSPFPWIICCVYNPREVSRDSGPCVEHAVS